MTESNPFGAEAPREPARTSRAEWAKVLDEFDPAEDEGEK